MKAALGTATIVLLILGVLLMIVIGAMCLWHGAVTLHCRFSLRKAKKVQKRLQDLDARRCNRQ